VGGVVAVALLAAWLAPRWAARRAARVPVDLSGIEGRIVFFSSGSCRRCDTVREQLRALNAPFTEVEYDDDADRFGATGVGAVPFLVGRDERGAVVARLAGAASVRRIRRLLDAAGVR